MMRILFDWKDAGIYLPPTRLSDRVRLRIAIAAYKGDSKTYVGPIYVVG
jgi:hypothetical protein